MGAQVQVNGSTTRSVVVPYGSTVSLTNASAIGTAQKWEILDYPLDIDDAGPDFATNFGSWTLAGDGTYFINQTPAYTAVTFKPDVTGTFLIRLTSTESGSPVIQTAVVRVVDFIGEHLPAAGESTESSSLEGWKRIHNGRAKRLAKRIQGFIRVANVSGSSIARGKVVKLIGTTDFHTISPNTNPGGTAAAKVERVFTIAVGDNTAAGAASAHFVILDQTLANNSVGWAQKTGLFEGGVDVSYVGFAAGDTLYLNSTGDQVNTPPGNGAKIPIGSVIGTGAGVGTATIGLPSGVVVTYDIDDYKATAVSLLGTRALGFFIDDFGTTPATTSTPLWQNAISGGSVSSSNTGDSGGTVKLSSSAVASKFAAIVGNSAVTGAPKTTKWYVAFRVKVTTGIDSQTTVAIGLQDVPGSGFTITAGVQGGVDAVNFRAQYDGNRAGSTLNLGLAIDTGYHVFELWCVGDSILHARVDGGTIVTGTMSSTPGSMMTTAYAGNGTTAADRSITMDWYLAAGARS